MAQGTQKVLGGTPAKRYPDPLVTNTPNAYGLYPWSAFRAPLVIITGEGQIEVVDGIEPSYIDLLLFTSDLPAICWLVAETSNSPPVVQFFNYVENNTVCQFLVAQPVAGSSLATVANIGQVLQGYVGNDFGEYVFCTGFNARVQDPVTSPYGTGEGSITKCYVTCIANAATISSPISYSQPFQPQGTLSAPEPVILKAGGYTQAIKDAGNIFVDSSGGVCLIVGLWAQPFL